MSDDAARAEQLWGRVPATGGQLTTLGYDKAVYEFKGGEGDAPERDSNLEEQLFGKEHHLHSGINFDLYDQIKVKVKTVGDIDSVPEPRNTFEEMDLHPSIISNIKLARYTKPTPVQKNAIPAILKGFDCMAHAQTGSGKTATFLVPLLSRLASRSAQLARNPREFGSRSAEPYVLICVPTRELANQIFDESRRFCYQTRFRPAVIYGGAPAMEQRQILQRGCDVLIATPGRLKDFLERGTVSLRKIKAFVLDEADRMLDMGFEQDIRTIAERSGMPDVEERQTLLFSATLPKEVRRMAQDFLKEDFLFIAVGRVGAAEKNVTQQVVWVEDYEKRDKLYELLMGEGPKGRTLIFCDTKRMADTIDDFLFNRSLPCTSLHGDRSQREREDALEAFRSGVCPILIATDVASRGLDIKDVVHVINFDCPKDIDSYVHRIGRTARAGNIGFATTFYNSRNDGMGPEITKILVEAGADVPEFLQQYNTQNLEYDDVNDEDFDEDTGGQSPTGHGTNNDNSVGASWGGGNDGGAGGSSWDSGAGGGDAGGSWDTGNSGGGNGGSSW